MPRGGDSEIKWGGKRAGAGQKPAPGESFKAARRRKESALADLRQLEVRTRRGVVVERDAVERSAFKWARVQRDAWLRWPAEVAPGIAEAFAIADSAALQRRLDEEVRQQLTTLSQLAFQLAEECEADGVSR